MTPGMSHLHAPSHCTAAHRRCICHKEQMILQALSEALPQGFRVEHIVAMKLLLQESSSA